MHIHSQHNLRVLIEDRLTAGDIVLATECCDTLSRYTQIVQFLNHKLYLSGLTSSSFIRRAANRVLG